jgi:histidyl-tRNA synthetase
VATRLRAAGFKTEVNLLDIKLDKQLKAASSSGARYAVILAPAELEKGEVNVKDLINREQSTVPIDRLTEILRRN